MINDLLKDIALEASMEDEDDLIADNVENSDLKDAFLEEEDNASDLSDSEIKDLIEKIPEYKKDVTKVDIKNLAENFELLINEDALFEQTEGDIDRKIATLEHTSVLLSNSLLENPGDEKVKTALRDVNGKIGFLRTIAESVSKPEEEDFEAFTEADETLDLEDDDLDLDNVEEAVTHSDKRLNASYWSSEINSARNVDELKNIRRELYDLPETMLNADIRNATIDGKPTSSDVIKRELAKDATKLRSKFIPMVDRKINSLGHAKESAQEIENDDLDLTEESFDFDFDL